MKLAISIRYGGEYVEADKCNASSYLELGLVCPCCRRSVYWVDAQERTRKTTTYRVNSYFAHPRAVSLEEAARCSERVASISPSVRLQNLESAKRQRARLFQQWFWNILDSHWLYTHWAEFDLASFLLTGVILSEEVPGAIETYRPLPEMQIYINGFGKNIEFAITSAEAFFEMMAEMSDGKEFEAQLLQSDVVHPGDVVVTIANLVREPLHQAIVKEAIYFLGARANAHLVRALFMHCQISEMVPDVREAFGNERYTKPQRAVMFYRLIGFILTFIPWANEFYRLSSRSELPPVASSYAGSTLYVLLDALSRVHTASNPDESLSDWLIGGADLPLVPFLKGLDFEREINLELSVSAINNLQYQGLKLIKDIKTKKKSTFKGFG